MNKKYNKAVFLLCKFQAVNKKIKQLNNRKWYNKMSISKKK